ncbi:MAG: hypothetical protein K9M45_09200 [Kiritimatiellales bacterium]|nr:hypothetical protein [Kiritimatiellales bacterium]
MKKLILIALLVCAGAWAENILIEAEKFAEARTESDDFAKVRTDPAASGKATLLRIFNEGTIHYNFTIEKPGTYTGWIRYTRRMDRAVQCEVNGKAFQVDSAASNAKTDKKDVWGWLRLFKTRLPAGQNELVMLPSAWKIDCMLIATDADYVPTDEVELAYKERKLTEQERALMDRSVIPLVPGFINDMPDYQLPEWFDGHRVQLHTRLGINRMNRYPEVFFNRAKDFEEMGATVFSRHMVSGGEGAWWPSKVGAIHEMAQDRNIAKEIIDDAHKHGLKLIAYNRHIEDDWAAETHPEWRCVGPDGEPLMASRGINMCMNSPFADYILTRQLELVDLGADGFFYDHVHMPREGCWCKYCRAKFTAMTGLKHPERIDPEDPLWHKLKEFNNYTIAQTFAKWRKALHARRPDVVMVVGSNLWPCLSDKHLDHRVFRIMDSHKTEFNKGTVYRSPKALWPFPTHFRPMDKDVRLGYGFDVARDASDGRPAHIWAHNIRYESHMLGAAAGVVAHGCIANLDVDEKHIPDPNFNSSFAMGDRVSPYLAGTQPLRQVAILHSEQARDRDGLDYTKVWQDTLYPIYGAYHVLLRDRIPCGFIFDSQLAQRKFDGIKFLFVPNMGNLSDELKAALADFRKGGGTVIENNPSWQWHTEEGWPDAGAQFRKKIAPLQALAQAIGGDEKMHLQAYVSRDGKKLTVCLANDFSWVQVGGKGEEGHVEGDTKESLNEKPPACSGVVLKLARKPKRVFDANTGKELKWTANGIKVPAFDYLAVIVAEY